MSAELERAANALFPSTGNSRVANVKFMRGHSRVITADQLANQLNRADAQVRANEATLITNIDEDLTA